MSFLGVALGVCMMLVVIGGVVGFWVWLAGGARRRARVSDAFGAQIEARLAEIERRLTDTQEVMLAIHDRLDDTAGVRQATRREVGA